MGCRRTMPSIGQRARTRCQHSHPAPTGSGSMHAARFSTPTGHDRPLQADAPARRCVYTSGGTTTASHRTSVLETSFGVRLRPNATSIVVTSRTSAGDKRRDKQAQRILRPSRRPAARHELIALCKELKHHDEPDLRSTRGAARHVYDGSAVHTIRRSLPQHQPASVSCATSLAVEAYTQGPRPRCGTSTTRTASPGR